MYYYSRPFEEGETYLFQLFLSSIAVVFIFGEWKYSILTFVVLVLLSMIPFLSAIIRFLFVLLYGYLGFMIGADNESTVLIFIFLGFGIGFAINFIDFEGTFK